MIHQILIPLIRDGPYRVLDVELVASRDNQSPFHQDAMTGRGVFKRDEAQPKAGFRVLIDLGKYVGAHESRTMAFKIGDAIVHATQCRMVAMNSLAAGSGRVGPVHHGRMGDGVTVSVDLCLPTRVLATCRQLRQRRGHVRFDRPCIGARPGPTVAASLLYLLGPQEYG